MKKTITINLARHILEKQKSQNRLLLIILICLVVLGVIASILTFSKVDASFYASCNTGKVDLNYSGQWLNQTEFLNEFIDINGIENLNCKFQGSFKGPWWLIALT